MDRQRERERGEGERERERIRPGVKQLGLRRRTLDRAPLIVLGNPRIRGVLRPLPKRSYFCRVATPNICPRACVCAFAKIHDRCGFLCDLDLPRSGISPRLDFCSSIEYIRERGGNFLGITMRNSRIRFDLSRRFLTWCRGIFELLFLIVLRYLKFMGCMEFGGDLAISIGFDWMF